MAATSFLHERLVHCDVSELHNVPSYDEALIVLKGSPQQVSWAVKVRAEKLEEWQPDLPENIQKALKGIADATWWIANRSKDSSNIGWPKSWAEAAACPPSQLGLPNRSALNGCKGKVIGAAQAGDVEEFDQFARKVCRSPELSYLTMMALLYRQTKDAAVAKKFQQTRETINGHLNAIDDIFGI